MFLTTGTPVMAKLKTQSVAAWLLIVPVMVSSSRPIASMGNQLGVVVSERGASVRDGRV
jgi:hypothetical protein